MLGLADALVGEKNSQKLSSSHEVLSYTGHPWSVCGTLAAAVQEGHEEGLSVYLTNIQLQCLHCAIVLLS